MFLIYSSIKCASLHLYSKPPFEILVTPAWYIFSYFCVFMYNQMYNLTLKLIVLNHCSKTIVFNVVHTYKCHHQTTHRELVTIRTTAATTRTRVAVIDVHSTITDISASPEKE